MNGRRSGAFTAGIMFLVAACAAGTVGAQVRVIQAGNAGGVGGVPAGNWSYLGIPGLYMLGNQDVQKELELVEDQKNQLREIAKKYQEEVRAAWSGVQQLPAEQRAEKYREIQKETQKLAADARTAAQKVLLAHQVDRLKKYLARSRAPYSLQNPQLQQDIGLDEKQRKQLVELRTELQKRIKELNDEMLDKALGVLTPEQTKKFEDATWKSLEQGSGYGYSYRRMTVQPREKSE